MKNLLSKRSFNKSFSLFLILAFSSNLKSQDLNYQNLSKWFSYKEIADKVYVIDDHGSDNFYLIEGKDSALLIDNGIGVANVRDYASSLTALPLIVVNTHGHPDHVGANYQFPLVYAHPADFTMIDFFNNPEQRKNAKMNALKDTLFTDNITYKDINPKPTVLKPIKQGYVFDLGERKLEVIEVPGHSPGSICLLDKKNKLLFTGDNNNTLAWLFLDGCEPLEVYLQSLNKLNKRNAEFNTLYPGHGEPIDKTFIEEQIKCVENILNGSCDPTLYKSFAGNAQLCTYKRSSVAYNVDNLYIEK
jgi:hydroxyacylglutathione hydrolase